MARRCTICFHPARAEIDRALALETVPFRHIAKRYGFSPPSVSRHVKAHIPKILAKRREKAVAKREKALAQAVDERERVVAVEVHDLRTDIAARIRVEVENEHLVQELARFLAESSKLNPDDREDFLRAVEVAGRCRDRQVRWLVQLGEGTRPQSAPMAFWEPTDPEAKAEYDRLVNALDEFFRRQSRTEEPDRDRSLPAEAGPGAPR